MSCVQSGKDQWPVGAYKDELVVHMGVSLPPRPQCSCRPAEGWNISPSMELPTNSTHQSERLKVIWREFKERGLAYFFTR